MYTVKVDNYSRAVCFSLAGTALFTPVFAAGKIADGAFPAIALMTIRYLSGFLTILAIVVASRVPLAELKSPKPSRHIIRAALGAAGGATAIFAASSIPIAYATSISLTRGAFVVFLAGVFLKEVVSVRRWLACLISMMGAFIIVWQSLDFTGFQDTQILGVLAAFAAAIFLAIEVLFVNYFSRRENALGTLLYVNGFGSLIMLFAAVVALDTANYYSWSIVSFAVLGPLAVAGQLCNIYAHQLADASRLSPVSYSWIVFATLLGILAFGEVPAPNALLGAVLIIVGGVVSASKK